jgi:hypothetical protein
VLADYASLATFENGRVILTTSHNRVVTGTLFLCDPNSDNGINTVLRLEAEGHREGSLLSEAAQNLAHCLIVPAHAHQVGH